jgi:hypothetical protein
MPHHRRQAHGQLQLVFQIKTGVVGLYLQTLRFGWSSAELLPFT